ncbi:glycosyltransferase family 39 protein [Streptomyces niveiscabiei]|uniref:glycosyltransferase family 39 protein n=2 Tax=Streptomyces TaxID=1883 RepID=UPI0029CA6D6F|nr:glycosyltransferase family 39 protein [Streptomyces niveiscabiei]
MTTTRFARARVPATLAVAVPVVVMVALGLWHIDRGGMWRDEAVTYEVGQRSLPQIWKLLHEVDAVHGLYYLFMHVVLSVHASEVTLRLPSVVGAAVAAGVVAAIGTRLARPRVGLWAGLLFACTPMVSHYAQEGRSYALVTAGALTATLLLLRALDGRPWWPYGLAVAVTCLLHEFAVLVLLAHGVTLILCGASRRAWTRWIASSGAAVLVLLPLVYVSNGQSKQVSWLARPDLKRVENLAHMFLGEYGAVFWTCVLLALIALPTRRRLSVATVAAPLLVVPPAVLLLVSQERPMYDDRYVLYALAGAPLLAAAGGDRILRGLSLAARKISPRAGSDAVEAPPARVDAQTLALRLDAVHAGARGEGESDGGGLAVVPQTHRDAPAGVPAGGSPERARGRVALRGAVALAGALAVAGAFAFQLPVQRFERTTASRGDDLAETATAAARMMRPGDAVMYLPAIARRPALTYPADFRGTRDMTLDVPGPESGTLYGTELSPARVRRNLQDVDRLWVVSQSYTLWRGSEWSPSDPVEKTKLEIVKDDFVAAEPRQVAVLRGTVIRLYVRKDRTS